MAENSIIIKKKKVHGHGGHHGGSWKVAYADFVTAMMAFFMVLWIVGLSDDKKMAISGYFQDPAGFMKNPAKSKNIVVVSTMGRVAKSNSKSAGQGMGDYSGMTTSELQEGEAVKFQLTKQLEGDMDIAKYMDHIEVKVTQEGLRVELLEDTGSVFFQSGSAVMRTEGKEIVKVLAPIIRNTGRFMVIEGHTDRKPYAGKMYTNWELSTERAIAMRRELSKHGIPNNRFKGVRGLADTQLRLAKKPFDASNRRVTLLLPWGSKVKSNPGSKESRGEIERSLAPTPVGKPDIIHH